MDSRRIIFLPTWARALMLILSIGVLLGSAAVAIHYTSFADKPDYVLLAMSVVQIALGSTLVVVALFYTQRDENIGVLRKRTDDFLSRQVKLAFERISIPEIGAAAIEVEDRNASDIFGRSLRLKAKGLDYSVWVGLNVHRIFAIYFVPDHPDDPDYVATIRRVFSFTFGGAEKVAFSAFYERSTVDGVPVVSIWLSAPTDKDLLSDPHEKLFWAQDLAMMTQSFLRTAARSGIPLTGVPAARTL